MVDSTATASIRSCSSDGVCGELLSRLCRFCADIAASAVLPGAKWFPRPPPPPPCADGDGEGAAEDLALLTFGMSRVSKQIFSTLLVANLIDLRRIRAYAKSVRNEIIS